MGVLNAQLGRADAALDALDRCITKFCSDSPILVAEPRLRVLHTHPRFRELAGRMNLSDFLASAR